MQRGKEQTKHAEGFARDQHKAVGKGYLDQTRRIAGLGWSSAVVATLLLVSYNPWAHGSWLESAIKGGGQCLILAAVLGRLWSTLYIGGRKNARLVTTGPYSVSRNPLYLFSTVGAVGVGFVFGSIAAGLILGGVTCGMLYRAARAEAELLRRSFGATYTAYADRVPLLWPRWSRYEDALEPTFNPRALHRALRDAMLFALALPASELVDIARSAGLLPRLVPLF